MAGQVPQNSRESASKIAGQGSQNGRKMVSEIPATAYNHFPDRMTDLFSSIVKLKLDVRETIMSMTTESKLIDTIKQIPYIYAKQMVDLGYTGQVIVSQMGHLQANNKWLEDDPVVVLTTLKRGYMLYTIFTQYLLHTFNC